MEKYLSASEYGSSIDGHPEVPEAKDGTDACGCQPGLGRGRVSQAARHGCLAHPSWVLTAACNMPPTSKLLGNNTADKPRKKGGMSKLKSSFMNC